MIDKNAETFVRDVFRDHEHLVDGAGLRLLPAVRARSRRRHGVRLAAVAVATAAALVGTVVTVSLWPTARPSPGAETPQRLPAGWRLESSLGVELAVPVDWTVNDYGCLMTERSSVVRGTGPQPSCGTPEPKTKQVAHIEHGTGAPYEYAGLTRRSVRVDGVPATRAEGRLADGRYAGSVSVPDRNVAVIVRTNDRATTRRILDSVRLVDVDHVGCTTGLPAVVAPPSGSRPTFVTPVPTAVSVCRYYPSYPSGPGVLAGPMVLDASASITGPYARQLADVLNAAPAGTNPDLPSTECRYPGPLVVLHLWAGTHIVDNVWITYTECTQRGLNNGARRAQVNLTVLGLVSKNLHLGYSASVDIPR